MNQPTEPFFVSPYKEESGGLDFLGLRQVNLSLIAQFLPGINNVTDALRPYSVMCWIAWSFKNSVESAGLKDLSSSQFKEYKEKVEILYSWSHQLTLSGKRMVGTNQNPPRILEGGKVPLRFTDWKRRVSWFDAVNYGPSAKSDIGLGFLTQPLQRIYAVTSKGEKLAKALDEKLRTNKSYPTLSDLSVSHATQAEALELLDAWKIDDPSVQEVEIYRHELYDEGTIGQASRIGHRSASIKLILIAIRAMNKPVTPDEIREFMANTQLFNKETSVDNEPLLKMQAIWRVLQVRQAHRLAFEAMFGWVEYRVMVFGRVHSSELVDDLINTIQENRHIANINNWVTDRLATIQSSLDGNVDLFSVAREKDEVNVFKQITALSKEINSHRDASAVRAIEILILCSVYEEFFLKDIYSESLSRLGGSARVSLEYWANFVKSNKTLPFSAFASKVIENFLLSQHFGVAAARYSEGKQRLRLTIEEHGLVSMLESSNSILSPKPAADRLEPILSLLKDSELLNIQILNGVEHYVPNVE